MELIDGTDLLTYVRGRTVDAGASTVSMTSGQAGGGFNRGRTTERPNSGATTDACGPGPLDASSTWAASGSATWALGKSGVTEAMPDERWGPPPSLPDLRRLRRTFRQVAEGTCALHPAGKLHRDIKPGNVLVRPDGRVILLDFGLVYPLALATQAESGTDGGDPRQANLWGDHSSDHGMVAGTLAYMSPEQGAAEPLTPASDWYAFGVMRYQALTGRLPFRDTSVGLLLTKQTQDGPAPSEIVPGIPEDLDRLCAGLLRCVPAERPSGPEVLDSLADEAASTAAGLPATDVPAFIGREKHLDEFRRAFGQVMDGRTAVCSVHGRSGAGKNALVQYFLDEVAAGGEAVILTGRCSEQESGPYKAVDSLMDALTRFLLHLDRAEVAALHPPDVAALTRIFPVLMRIDAVEEATHGVAEISDLRQQRARAFGALREPLTRIAARWPLIAWVDDLQWGDVDGATLLSYVLRPPGGPRLLLLLTYRSESIGVSPYLRALRIPAGSPDSPAQSTLVGEALTPAETLQFAEMLLSADLSARSQAEWVARESGGSAYFVHELVRHLRSGQATTPAGGVDLDRILWLRVLDLPPEGRRLLEVVAVASRPLRLRIAQEVAGHGPLPPHMISLLRSGHLVRTAGPHLDDEIEAYHDRIRESVVAHLSGPERQATHAGLAEALEDAGGADPRHAGGALRGRRTAREGQPIRHGGRGQGDGHARLRACGRTLQEGGRPGPDRPGPGRGLRADGPLLHQHGPVQRGV